MIRARTLTSALVISACLVLTAGFARATDGCGEADGDCLPPPPGLTAMVPDLDILKTPSSPALSLVGGDPLDIKRPTTPMGAAASLATGLARGLFVPGTTTTVEVTPYWLMQHPFLTAQHVEGSRAWTFARDLSVSVAAAPGVDPAKPTDAPATSNSRAGLVALGLRTTIWPGAPSPAARACAARIDAFMADDVNVRASDEEAFAAAWIKAHPKPTRVEVPRPVPLTPATALDWKKKMDAANAAVDHLQTTHINTYNDALKEWLTAWKLSHPVPADVAACSSIIHHRVGFMVSTAGAVLLSAPDGDFNRFHQGGTAGETGWLTAGYAHSFGQATALDLSAFGALRFRHQRIIETSISTNAVDVGARVVAAFTRWGVSLQGMRLGPGANGFGSARAWQGGVAVDYHLKSGYWLTGTAGSSDLGNLDSIGAVTALVHVQYNVGRDRLIPEDVSATQPAPSTDAGGGGAP